jgi:excisionase family DNA binding protein
MAYRSGLAAAKFWGNVALISKQQQATDIRRTPMASNDLLSNPDRLLTVDELAEVTGVPVQTIYKWPAKGTGPRRMRVGRHIRYRASDVKTWLDGQYVD